MKNLFLFFFMMLLLGTSTSLYSQDDLFLVDENGLYGYINVSGEMIIKPQFRSAYPFSGGHAAVRKNGEFGVIDLNGKYVVEPIYDFVQTFNNGTFWVWLAGAKKRLNGFGNEVPMNQRTSRELPNDHRLVEVDSAKFGVLNQQNEFVIDTIFKRHQIRWSEGDYYIVSQKRKIKDATLLQSAVYDSIGNMVVPFGKYVGIKSLGQGWFSVFKYNLADYAKVSGNYLQTFKSRNNQEKGFLHLKDGKFRSIIDTNVIGIEGLYGDGLIPIIMNAPGKRFRYRGYIDTVGQLVLEDSIWTKVSEFSQGVAMIRHRLERKTFLINKKGEQLHEIGITKWASPINANQYHLNKRFINNWAVVQTDDGIAKIHRSGKMEIIKELHGMYFGYMDGGRYLNVIGGSVKGKNSHRSVYDMVAHKRLPIDAEYVHPFLKGDNLFECRENNQTSFIDTAGIIVWQQSKPLKVYPHDLDEMVFVKLRKSNPRLLNWVYRFFLKNPRLYIGFRPKKIDNWPKKLEANNLYLINPSNDTLIFKNCYGRELPIKIEAKDLKGEWRTVNQYSKGRQVKPLPPGHYWYYRLPKFEGYYKTTFRATIPYFKNKNSDEVLELVKEFKGGINPIQFSRDTRQMSTCGF